MLTGDYTKPRQRLKKSVGNGDEAMKTFKTNTRYNISKNQNEVNCEGFFNSDFFTLIELIKRQDEVYALYSKHDENANEYGVLYEALEHMRVALITLK